MLTPLYTPRRPGEEEITPWANGLLIGLIAATSAMSFGFQALSESTLFEDPLLQLALQREGWTAWQLIGSTFLHADLAHLLGNLIALFALGTVVNRMLGNAKYLLLTLGSAVLGGLAWLWLGEGVAAMGASGAVFGVAGAFLVLAPRREVQTILPLPWLAVAMVATVYTWANPITTIEDMGLLLDFGMWVGLTAVVALGVHAVGTIVDLIASPKRRTWPRALAALFLGLRFPRVAAGWLVFALIAWELFAFGFSPPADAWHPLGLVAHQAHLGGLLAGLGVTVVFCGLGMANRETKPKPRPRISVPPTRRYRRRAKQLTYSEWANQTLELRRAA